jgi:hypothetical protein
MKIRVLCSQNFLVMFLEFVREENNFFSRGNKKSLAKKIHAFSMSAGKYSEEFRVKSQNVDVFTSQF